MKVEIFNKNIVTSYKKLISDFQLDLDIYYQLEFLELEAERVEGEYEIFTVCDYLTRKVFIYPYLKVSIQNEFKDYFDLTSPYGYAGPFCNSSSFFSAGENEFLKYTKKQNIVSEFVRYHFIYNEEKLFAQNIQNEHNRTIVIFDLRLPWEQIWRNNISQNNRNYTNKFNKEGFVLEITGTTEYLDEFISMYNQTMENAGAVESFFFPKGYFYKLFEKLDGKIKLGRIIKNNITYASVLFFVSGGFVHPYLNGRALGYKKMPSSAPLYINIAKWAKENGLQLLNMGGGRTNSPDDSLFMFKKHLSNQFKKFYIGKRIHNSDIYQQIVSKYITVNGIDNYEKIKDKLQFYR